MPRRESRCPGSKCLKCGKRSDHHECQHAEEHPEKKVPTVIVTAHRGCGIWATYDGQPPAQMTPDVMDTAPPWLAFFLGALGRQVSDIETMASPNLMTTASIADAPRWVKEALASAALSALAEPEAPEKVEPKPC